jgi:hypothetical protein
MSISYLHGDFEREGSMVVSAIFHELVERGVPHAVLLVCDEGQKWRAVQIHSDVIGVHVVREANESIVVAITFDGDECDLVSNAERWSSIDQVPDGPGDLSPLTESRCIDGPIVAVGMQRRVYTRISAGVWRRIDDGCRVLSSSQEISGFLSVDGANVDNMMCVGYGGLAWVRAHGDWVQLDSPTNRKLTVVRYGPRGLYFIGGASGIMYLFSESAGWLDISSEGVSDTIACAEWVGGCLYFAIEGGALFVLDEQGTILKVNECSNFPVYGLSARQDQLLAVGPLGLMLKAEGSWRLLGEPAID